MPTLSDRQKLRRITLAQVWIWLDRREATRLDGLTALFNGAVKEQLKPDAYVARKETESFWRVQAPEQTPAGEKWDVEYTHYTDSGFLLQSVDAEARADQPFPLQSLQGRLEQLAGNTQGFLDQMAKVDRPGARQRMELLAIDCYSGPGMEGYQQDRELACNWLGSGKLTSVNLGTGELIGNSQRTRFVVLVNRNDTARAQAVDIFVRSVLQACLVRRYKLDRYRKLFERFEQEWFRDGAGNPATRLRKSWYAVQDEAEKLTAILDTLSQKGTKHHRLAVTAALRKIRTGMAAMVAARSRLELHRITARTNLNEIDHHLRSQQALILDTAARDACRKLLTEGLEHLPHQFEADLDYSKAVEEYAHKVVEGLNYYLEDTERRFTRAATVVVAALGAIPIYEFIQKRWEELGKDIQDPLAWGTAIGNLFGVFAIFLLVVVVVYRTAHNSRLHQLLELEIGPKPAPDPAGEDL